MSDDCVPPSNPVPDGMGVMSCHSGGICEQLPWIMSYEDLCLAQDEVLR